MREWSPSLLSSSEFSSLLTVPCPGFQLKISPFNVFTFSDSFISTHSPSRDTWTLNFIPQASNLCCKLWNLGFTLPCLRRCFVYSSVYLFYKKIAIFLLRKTIHSPFPFAGMEGLNSYLPNKSNWLVWSFDVINAMQCLPYITLLCAGLKFNLNAILWDSLCFVATVCHTK